MSESRIESSKAARRLAAELRDDATTAVDLSYLQFERRVRPERRAGGFSRDDGLVHFYTRVSALADPQSVVLDYGAGRGRRERSVFKGRISSLKGKVRKVVGVDVDPVVRSNSALDEAHVIEPGQRLPFGSGTFDLLVSDWVFEHIEDPASFAAEAARVLKPGGWLCARTPNRRGYVALGARLFGGPLQNWLIGRLQPRRKEHDIFDKFYRLNTLGTIQACFPAAQFHNCSYYFNPEPDYHGFNPIAYQMINLYQRLAPPALKTNLMVFLQKKHG